MKVFMICVVFALAALAYAQESGGREGTSQAGGFHHAGYNAGGGGPHTNIGGYPGTYHGGDQNGASGGRLPGNEGGFHHAGYEAQGGGAHENIGGQGGVYRGGR